MYAANKVVSKKLEVMMLSSFMQNLGRTTMIFAVLLYLDVSLLSSDFLYSHFRLGYSACSFWLADLNFRCGHMLLGAFEAVYG